MKYKELEKVAMKLSYSIRKIDKRIVIEKDKSEYDRTNIIIIRESQKDNITIDVWATCS